jgi:hypothetical protein
MSVERCLAVKYPFWLKIYKKKVPLGKLFNIKYVSLVLSYFRLFISNILDLRLELKTKS